MDDDQLEGKRPPERKIGIPIRRLSDRTKIGALLSAAILNKKEKKKEKTIKKAKAVSLFKSMPTCRIEEERKSLQAFKTNPKDILVTFGICEPWLEISQQIPPFHSAKDKDKDNEKEEKKTNFEPLFRKIVDIFAKVSLQFAIQSDEEHYAYRSFSDDFVYSAVLAIEYAYDLISQKLSTILSNDHYEQGYTEIEDLFSSIRTLNDFFFLLIKLKCNTVISERNLQVLFNAIKIPFTFLQQKVNKNLKLISDLPSETKKRQIIASYIYYCLQMVACLSILGEPVSLSKTKYEYVVDRFKGVFALLAQSMVCEKIFNESNDFEYTLEKTKRRIVASSYGLKRLSIFLQRDKLPEEDVNFSLKFVLLNYNYKILKIINQRVQVSYDEHILSVFHSMVFKNKAALSSLMAQKDKQNVLGITLIINENVYIMKTYILSLVLMSEELDTIQRQLKYETIKDICIDSLNAAIKLASNNCIFTAKTAVNLTINKPKDLLGLIFNTLILFKKCLVKKQNLKHAKEIEANLNSLIAELMSRPIPTDDPVCFQLYKLYLLQFIRAWDVKFLKEKHVKYAEEMSRYLSGFEEEKISENEVLTILNKRVSQLALDIFVMMATIDCGTAIEITVALIRDSFTSEQKLSKYFHILACILLKKSISPSSFNSLITWDDGQARRLFSGVEKSLELVTFFQKDAMRILFMNFQNTILSYKQTRDQTKIYDDNSVRHKRSDTIETDTFALAAHLRKLDATVDSYRKLLDMTASFICSLHRIKYFTEHFLMNCDWSSVFSEVVLMNKKGHKLMHQLISVLHENSIDNEALLGKYVALIVDLLRKVHAVSTNAKHKKVALMSFGQFLINIIDSEEVVAERRRAIIFEKAVIPLFADLCRRDEYENDTDVFLLFLRLVKFVSRGNSLFDEYTELRLEVNELVISRYKSILNKESEYLETTRKILDELIEIAVDTDFNIYEPHPVLLKESMALEAYFKIVNLCLKKSTYEVEQDLSNYILAPFKALSQSLINLSLIARTSLPCCLLEILKRTVDESIVRQISNYIGNISSIHATPKQIKLILSYFVDSTNKSHRGESSNFYQILLDTLLNVISGESIKEFFYFDGHDESFIQLKPSIVIPSNGLCLTGYIRFECRDLNRTQCLFSFFNNVKKDGRGFEIVVRNAKVVYRLVNLSKSHLTQEIVFDECVIREDVWHHFTLCHIHKEVTLFMDYAIWTKEIPENFTFPKQYNSSTIGARFDMDSSIPRDHFFGEMSTICFFVPSQKVKDALKELAFGENFLPYMYLEDKETDSFFFEPSPWKTRKLFLQELMPNNCLLIEPKHYCFNPNGKEQTQTQTKSLQKVSLIINCPGKEVFSNIGGLKTAFPLIMDRALKNSKLGESEVNICVGIMRLIHCLCLNNSTQTIRFLTQENGIEILRYVFEKIGKFNSFSKTFVDALFNILNMPIHYNTWKAYRLVPLIIEQIAFNMDVWISSDFSVQAYLLERISDFISQQTGIQFSAKEPFKSLLFMMFDYRSPVESEINEIKDFLNEISSLLQSMLVKQLQMRGRTDSVRVLIKYLLPDAEKLDQIKDLLYVIARYQKEVAKENKPSIFSEYISTKENERDLDSIGLLSTLFLIMHTAISHRHQLNAIEENNDVQIKAKIECMEEIIAYCTDILLSISWSKIYENLAELKGLDESMLKILRPGSKYKTTEKIILTYLILRPSYTRSGKSTYEKLYLGKKVYKTLLRRIYKQSVINSKFSFEFDENTQEIDQTIINFKYVKILYKTIMQNVSAFQTEVQVEIFNDIKRFLANSDTYSEILKSETIAFSMTHCLTKKKYYSNPIFRPSIEDFIVHFIIYCWGKKEMKKSVTQIFLEMQKLDINVFISISKELIRRLTAAPGTVNNAHGIFLLIQFVYCLEDVAINNSIFLADHQFAELMSSLLSLLDNVEMLYFWLPSFGPQSFSHDLKLAYDPKCTQREGGIVRIILRLLFAMVIRMDEKESGTVINLLDFFIFHNTKPFNYFSKESISEEKKGEENSGFMKYSITNSSKRLSTMKQRTKTISHEKSIVQQKAIEDLQDPSKDVYESPAYKLLLLFTYIEQCIIYINFNVTSYKEIAFYELDSELQEKRPMSPKVKQLILLLGKIANEISTIETVSAEVEKRYNRLGKFQIKNCISDIDMLPKELTESFHYEIGTPTVKDSSKYVDYAIKSPAISTESTSTPSENTNITTFREDLMLLLSKIRSKFRAFRDKKLDEENYIQGVASCLLSTNTIKIVQSGLHDLITEDYKYIEKAIFLYCFKRNLALEKIQSTPDKSPA